MTLRLLSYYLIRLFSGFRANGVTLLLTFFLLTTSVGAEDIDVHLPSCGSLLQQVDDSAWKVEKDDTVISFWGDGKYYLLPGRGTVYAFSNVAVKKPGVKMGVSAQSKNATTIFTSSGNAAVMIDAGGTQSYAVYDYQIKALAKAMNVKRLQGLHISHGDKDHYNRLKEVVRRFGLKASQIVIPYYQIPLFSNTFWKIWNKLARDPQLKGRGFDKLSPGNQIFKSVSNKESRRYYRVQFQHGDLIVEYTASKSAIDVLRAKKIGIKNKGSYADAASAIKSIGVQGSINRIIVLGDLRGRDYLTLSKEMGEDGFKKLFYNVPILKGFHHHLGHIKTAEDVEGMLKVIKYSGARDPLIEGPLRITVQTTDKFMVKTLIKALNMLGIEVITVQRGSSSVISHLLGSVYQLAKIGDAVKTHPPTPEGLEIARLYRQLRSYQEVLKDSKFKRSLSKRFPDQTRQLDQFLKGNFSTIEAQIFGGLGDETLKKLLHPTRKNTSKAENRKAKFNLEKIADAHRKIMQTANEYLGLMENKRFASQLDVFAKDNFLGKALREEMRAALEGKSSSPLMIHLLEKLDPDLKRALKNRWREGKNATSSILNNQRMRNEFLSAITTPTDAPSSLGLRAKAAGAAGIELARFALDNYLLYRDAKQKGITRAYEAYFWWLNHGTVPMALGMRDNAKYKTAERILTVLTKNYHKINDETVHKFKSNTNFDERFYKKLSYMRHHDDSRGKFISRLQDRFENHFIDRNKEALLLYSTSPNPNLFDEFTYEIPDWDGFMLWAFANIENFDDYRYHLNEFSEAYIRRNSSKPFPKGPWEYKVFRKGLAGSTSYWVKDDNLSKIMEALANNMIRGTEQAIDEIWAKRTPKIKSNGLAFVAAPDAGFRLGLATLKSTKFGNIAPTGKAKFKATGSAYSLYEPKTVILNSSDWWDKKIEFFIYENEPAPKGYVMVSGATYNTYAAIRSAKLRMYNPVESEYLPIPSQRSIRQKYLYKTAQIQGGELVVNDDASAIINYWKKGSNQSGLAYVKRSELAIEEVKSQPKSILKVTKKIAFPVCSYFNESIDNWQEFNGKQLEPAKKDSLLFSKNGFLRSEVKDERIPVEMVLAFDITGSMEEEINQVRQSAQKITRSISRFASSFKLGLVPFRDYQDNSADARKLFRLTREISLPIREMDSWSASGGGGDGPEDQLYALAGALEHGMGWSGFSTTAKIILVISDAKIKLNSAGRDFNGETIESIANLAKYRNVVIHSLVLGNDSAMIADAERLTSPTGGKVYTLAEPEKLAQSIIESVQETVFGKRRYWQSPSKFAGNQLKYWGRNLEFDLSCTGDHLLSGMRDIELSGNNKKANIYAYLTPTAKHTIHHTEKQWNHYAVRLDSSANWRKDEKTPSNHNELISILRNLDEIRIRSQYYQGANYCDIDNVELGGWGEPNISGLSNSGLQTNNTIDSTAQQLNDKIEWVKDKKLIEQTVIENLAGLESAPYYRLTVHNYTRDISQFYTYPSYKNVTDHIYKPYLKILKRFRDKMQASGELSKGDRHLLKLYQTRFILISSQIDQTFKLLLRIQKQRAEAHARMESSRLPSDDYRHHQDLLYELDKEEREVKSILRSLIPG